MGYAVLWENEDGTKDFELIQDLKTIQFFIQEEFKIRPMYNLRIFPYEKEMDINIKIIAEIN